MRISLKWLSEYVDLPGADELARRLTAVGLEVEAIERTGQGLDGVVAGRILASEKHPNAEKLSVTRVDAGGAEPLQIVCGAKNYAVGDLVPVATVGTTLPGGMKIEKAKLRGTESFGMLCSAKELGLAPDASGLLILPADAKPGTPVVEVLQLADTFFEINVTPNRPDALSHIGIAREVAAILGKPIRMPATGLAESGPPASGLAKVRIEAPEKCPRYAARVIEGVKIGPSPLWLQRRLEGCGVRSISNVVDATNFVLLELGHPLHAFDLDKVGGRQIVVRTARKGEKITTLDGKERALEVDDLLIADANVGSALAGVMGGGVSEISAGTSRVLLESAYFQPGGIRRTSRRQGLKSEASYRFERGADTAMVLPALDRCAALIAQLSGGTVRQGIVDVHPRPAKAAEVRLRWARPAQVLGMQVARDDARKVLTGLGFAEKAADADGATFVVPSWRVDVSIEEDLVEEIVRTRGYDAIPETLPRIAIDRPVDADEIQAASRVRQALEASGFSEAVNFSFVAERELEPFERHVLTGDGTGRALGVALKNPISAELSVMRTSLIPSLLKNAVYNRRQRVEDVRLYEIASVYHTHHDPRDRPTAETIEIGAVLCGRRSPIGWAAGAEPLDFYDAKAAVQGILDALGVDTRWVAGADSWLHPRTSAKLLAAGAGQDGDEVVGEVGEIHPRVAGVFDLPRGVLAFRLSLDALLRRMKIIPQYRPVPRLPAVLRDLAVVVKEEVTATSVEQAIREEPLVEAVTLFDVYRGAPLPAGKKNLALAITYRGLDRTLTDAEADAAHGRILKRLAEKVGAELRGHGG